MEGSAALTLQGTAPTRLPAGPVRSLLSFAQISDAHLIDTQSPARVEYFARVPGDQPGEWPFAGAFRAHELLSAHLLFAMLQAAQAARSPTTGVAPGFLIHTGDACDNAQRNELCWFLALLQGREVAPNSGGSHYEGVQATTNEDPWYYHPHDAARDRYGAQGLPTLSGLLEVALRPLPASGFALPWYGLPGNHDLLLQGLTPPNAGFEAVATGGLKALAQPQRYLNVRSYLQAIQTSDPELIPAVLAQYETMQDVLAITPDPERTLLSYATFLDLHRQVSPAGPGLPARALPDRGCFGFAPVQGLYCLGLDTVVRAGGEAGALDSLQAAWLEEELAAHSHTYFHTDGRRLRGGGNDRLLIFCHHPLATLTNGLAQEDRAGQPLLGPEVTALLHRFPAILAIFNGHTHQHRVLAHLDPAGQGPGFWEITTASLIDWPQQGRLVELLSFADDTLALDLHLLDHHGLADPPLNGPWDTLGLAGLGRLLGRLDFQLSSSMTEASQQPRTLRCLLP